MRYENDVTWVRAESGELNSVILGYSEHGWELVTVILHDDMFYIFHKRPVTEG